MANLRDSDDEGRDDSKVDEILLQAQCPINNMHALSLINTCQHRRSTTRIAELDARRLINSSIPRVRHIARTETSHIGKLPAIRRPNSGSLALSRCGVARGGPEGENDIKGFPGQPQLADEVPNVPGSLFGRRRCPHPTNGTPHSPVVLLVSILMPMPSCVSTHQCSVCAPQFSHLLNQHITPVRPWSSQETRVDRHMRRNSYSAHSRPATDIVASVFGRVLSRASRAAIHHGCNASCSRGLGSSPLNLGAQSA